MQDAAFFWDLFVQTGSPEAYVAYKEALKTAPTATN